MRGVFLTSEDQAGILDSSIFRNEQNLSNPAGMFEILASQHVTEKNVEELFWGTEAEAECGISHGNC